MAIAALVLGIISLFFGSYIGFVIALLAIIFAIIGLNKGEKKGFCISGLVMGINSLIWCLIQIAMLLSQI